ncbi:hypothetical protein D3C86_1464510 [compost metagenome]
MGQLEGRAAKLVEILKLEEGILQTLLKQATAAGRSANTSAGAQQGGANVGSGAGLSPRDPVSASLPYDPADIIKQAKGGAEWANRDFLGMNLTGLDDQRGVVDWIQKYGNMAAEVGDTQTADALREVLKSFRFLRDEEIVPQFAAGGLIPDQSRFDGMPAQLHRGEMVLPREITQGLVAAIRGGLGGLTVNVTLTGNYIHPATDLNQLAHGLAPIISRQIGERLERRGLT